MIKVISFSLWGSVEPYLPNIELNVELAKRYYHGWVLRVYCDKNIPLSVQERLYQLGYDVHFREHQPGTWDGLFWRFEAAFDPEVSVFISRDMDSRLNPREAAAVKEWLQSRYRIHGMQDNAEHTRPLMGGLWGSKHWPEFEWLYRNWTKRQLKYCDQEFLFQEVWPLVREKNALIHNRYVDRQGRYAPLAGEKSFDPRSFWGDSHYIGFPEHLPLDEFLHGRFVGAPLMESPVASMT